MVLGNVSVGDRVRVVLSDHSEEGVLMPNSDDSVVLLKLDNGYNVGFEKSKVAQVNLISKKEKGVESSEHVVKRANPQVPTIAVLHTGGTIASKIDYSTGGVVAKISAADLMEMVPELDSICNVESETIFNMMSEDMSPSEYEALADALFAKASEEHVKGIIVGHGTDTLGMTSAIISFMLKNVKIPIVFVGSQRSSDRGSSDAAMNLICAAQFISQSDAAGVFVCMHENSSDDSCIILSGVKTRKMHTSRRDAFKGINGGEIARVSYPEGKVEMICDEYTRGSDVSENLELMGGLCSDVAILKTYPGMKPSVFDFYRENGYKGVIIEGTGIGHAPTNSLANQENYLALKRLVESGVVVGITSSCLNGAVHEFIYSNTRRLGNIGVVFCQDMFCETAFMKLMWLLGNYSAKEASTKLAENICGEISEKLAFKETFNPKM